MNIRILFQLIIILTDWMAVDKRISCISWWTIAYWTMINNLTYSSYSTCSRTWIFTLLITTSFILITIRISSTFWSTQRRWPDVIWYTWTYSMIINFSTLTIRSTRWRVAWINLSLNYINKYLINYCIDLILYNWYITFNWLALKESISRHFVRASTHRYMIIYITNSILSTNSRTRIFTFIFYTSFLLRTVIIYNTFRSTSHVRISLIF